ncbi:MAG TPA: hypothetical protein ENI79_04200 [Rhodospirillales bacterium]|nr:hypothetical protein [Rhodospirillales bacterium]
MQHKVIKVMQRYWPESYRHVLAVYDGIEPLQDWLDENVVWKPETPPTALEIQAKEADYDAALLTARKKAVATDVRDEAEKRIHAGTLIDGVQFKCDDQSINRVHGMLTTAKEAEAASLPFSQTFMTETGGTVTINGAAEASDIFSAASGFVGMVLSASAELQGQVSPMTAAELDAFDASDPVHWP